ncbi:MAG: DNA primase DnaG [archaeon]|nr:DNA primase [Nanoarchaeota archaeon]MBU1005637.1 DNA primase [Nanoarchaeota archaeon]MBU1945842.1 DNA primase [Nanoarchaeota archaeon]
MGKISPVSSKYIINTVIEIDGVVDRPDVIGAIFGQTEGLLGADLELRELQRSGRIGRIEVNVDTRTGKTTGTITIPSSLDKAETSIVAAALEIIQRIGPCNAKIKVQGIEDVRVTKRAFVIERAKELLKKMMEGVIPDSQELADEVAYSVRVMEIQEYGKDRLPAGPGVDDSDEIIVVEGRADVLNLLKHGFKNVIALNGTSVTETIIELSKKKVLTVFVDGDRGGRIILKGLINVAEIDFVAMASAGKEVEEITKKEIHKALRGRVSVEQVKLELGKDIDRMERPPMYEPRRSAPPPHQSYNRGPTSPPPQRTFSSAPRVDKKEAKPEEKKVFREMLENLVGTRGAHILDDKLNILGKVPISELETTIKSLSSGVYAVVFDGNIEKELVKTAEKANISFLVGMDSKIKSNETSLRILTAGEL